MLTPHAEARLDKTGPTTRNAVIDLMRAIAIAEVLLHHLVDQAGATTWTKVLRGPIGVQVFFVLSGWLLGGQLFRTLARHGRIDVVRFWSRRWLRTMPAYYAILVLRAVAGGDKLAESASMFVFAQNYLAPEAWVVSWSLCVQEYFYLALPFALLLSRRVRSLGVGLGVAFLLVSPVLRWYTFDASLSPDAYFATIEAPTHTRLDGVVLGVLLAAMCEGAGPLWTWCRGHARPIAAAGIAVIAAVSFGSWFFDPETRQAPSALACATGILGLSVGAAMLLPLATVATSSPRWWHAPATWVADHAYVLYLVHTTIFGVVLANGRDLHLPFPARAAAAIAATLCAGWAVRRVVEKPALRARQKLMDRPSSMSVAN